LNSLLDRNETLFYDIVRENITEMAPILYTPTVGLACKEFGKIMRRPRGMYFSSQDRGHFTSMMFNWPHDEVDVIVVTDGSRILGLGDLGSNGMGIPIGKLTLYVACAGINPHRVLPIMLDMGTNNPDLLNDPYYLGMQHPRLGEDDYINAMDEFINAVRERYPNAFIQFEDFD
jgi:malic enzyme